MAAEVLVGHADGGGEAAEEEAAGPENAPEVVEHGVEVSVVAGEVEDGAADDEVEGIGWVGDGLDGFDAEVAGREVRGEGSGESAGLGDGVGILVGGEDLVAFAEEVDEIASGTAAGIEDTHAGHDVAAQDLVEEVDVDLAELLLEGGHRFKRMIQDGAARLNWSWFREQRSRQRQRQRRNTGILRCAQNDEYFFLSLQPSVKTASRREEAPFTRHGGMITNRHIQQISPLRRAMRLHDSGRDDDPKA